MRKALPVLLFLLATCHMPLATCFASSGTLSVTPQIQTIDLKVDPPVASVTYENTTPNSIQLSLSIEDFKSVDEIGTPQLINSSENYKYGLSSWVKIESNSIVLAPNEKKTVELEIEKERLSQGGHYAAVLAEINQEVNNKKVHLKGVLAALLFVRADSKYNSEQAKIASVFPNKTTFNFPDTLFIRFQNTGNIDLAPHGLVEIKDIFGRTVARGIVNENSLISMPETIRKYTITLNNITQTILPGMYTAKVSIHYGESDQKIVTETKFVYFGLPVIIIIIFIIVITIISRSFLAKLKRGNKQLD